MDIFQTTKKQSLCLDNDGSTIKMSDWTAFSFYISWKWQIKYCSLVLSSKMINIDLFLLSFLKDHFLMWEYVIWENVIGSNCLKGE